MVKHTQTIRRQIADELSECVLPFCAIGAKRARIYKLRKSAIEKAFIKLHYVTN